MERHELLTEVVASTGEVIILVAAGATTSNARHIPYSEVYLQSSGLMASPLQHLQEAVEDSD